LNDLPAKLAAALGGCPPRCKYLAGISGGRDSMALLHALHALDYGTIVVCHLDHRLRGRAAAADAAFVRRAAERLGYACETGRAEVAAMAAAEKKSIELAAREARRVFFAECARRQRCPRLFLAHHADDQLETMLFNFLRGAGAAGLGGMKPVSRRDGLEVYRPMLEVTRAEIDAYVREQRIRYREDASNADPAHTRNALRHRVAPAIRQVMGESFPGAVRRAGEILREENAWMESLVPPVGERLSRRALLAMPLALQRRTVLRWLRQSGVDEAGFAETALVLSLLEAGPGSPAKVNLPGARHARRRAGEIFLEGPHP